MLKHVGELFLLTFFCVAMRQERLFNGKECHGHAVFVDGL